MADTVEPRRATVAATIACAAAVLCATFLGLGVGGLNTISNDQARNSALLERAMDSRSRRTFENVWTSDGQTYRVAVSSLPGESTAELVIRFEAELAAAKEVHPPDPRR